MGRNNKKRRSGRRRRKSGAEDVRRQYTQNWRKKVINSALDADEFHEKQSKYHKEISKKEKDMLSRSIYVTCVRDLNVESNLRALEMFFITRYGPVKHCSRCTPHNKVKQTRFPAAQVVFFQKSDAEKIFGQELFRVRKAVELDCPVGHKNGKIMVRPCHSSSDLLMDETEGSLIKIHVTEFCLGHWCPAELEMDNLDNTSSEKDWWFEVEKGASPQLVIDLTKRCIELIYHSESFDSFLSEIISRKISFRFKHLLLPIKLCQDGMGRFSIIFSLKHPPRVYEQTVNSLIWGLSSIRVPDFQRSIRWDGLSDNSLGRCLGYKLYISEDQIRSLLLHEKCNQLREFGVISFGFDALQNPNPIQTTKVHYDSDKKFEAALEKIKNFKLASLLSTLRDNGKLTAYHAINDRDYVGTRHVNILDAVASLRGRTVTAKVQMVLEQILGGYGYTKYPCRLMRKLLFDAQPREAQSLPPHCVLVPRMRVSPLRTICAGFEIETSNRAIRHFSSSHGFDIDMFMRVTVMDDDGGLLMGSDLTADVEGEVRRALLEGVKLCGRTYKFLAYSSSQLKECSAWMVCCDDMVSWSVVKMRKELGNFSTCTTASKLGARLGQCFSTTFTEVTGNSRGEGCLMPTKQNYVVDDIEGSRGCHSDGTGMIRRDVLDELLIQLPIGIKDCSKVSIIQIRYGGAKGTLTAFNDPTKYLAPGTPKVDIYLRPSMIKFHAPYTDLEVCSVGNNIPYYLNRNVILLLCTVHGLPAETFVEMQQKMLDDLDGMLYDLDIAQRLVPALAGPDSEQRSMLLHMLYAGISPLNDPFLYDCLSAVRSHHLFSLRKKTRIWVEKGAVLMGGIDETGQLPEEHVFFQVGNQPHVGWVLVTKHPVMHPGDVRMLKAVDIPELRGHHNMILFSRHGDRPEADKMSGSDLDGDEFAVCWDERLFLRRNLEAMDYEGAKDVNNDKLPNDPERVTGALVQHFLAHIKNASLGQIAMLWLDHAASKGAGCWECIELAGLHSIAVDYPKSGVPAVIPDNLKLKSTEARPHWREKKNSPSYHCQSVIGKLYDKVISVEKANRKPPKALAGRKVDKYGTIVCEFYDSSGLSSGLPTVYDPRIPLGLTASNPEFEKVRKSLLSHLQILANEERLQYDTELLEIMNKYRIRSEGETYTGCIRKYHKLQKKRQHDFTQEVRRQYGEMRKKFRRSFFEHVASLYDLVEGRNLTMENLTIEEDEDDVDTLPEALLDETEDTNSEGSLDEERISDVERVVKTDLTEISEHDKLVHHLARWFAAAYYDAAYHHEHRWRNQHLALFSFPWLVADIIGQACAPYLKTNV